MNNKEISIILNDIADAYEIIGESFRALPFARSAQKIENDANAISDKVVINEIKYINKHGYSKKLRRLRSMSQYRAYILFCNIMGVGEKTARKMVEAGLRTLSDVAKKWTNLTEDAKAGIKYYSELNKRTPRSDVSALLKKIASLMPRGVSFMPLGSYRRGAKTIGDLDIIIFLNGKRVNIFPMLIKAISIYLIRSGDSVMSLLAKVPHNHVIRCDFFICEVGTCPEYVQYGTGSREHNIKMRAIAKSKGFKLNQYGLYCIGTGKKIDIKSEQELYEFLGQEYPPPSCR